MSTSVTVDSLQLNPTVSVKTQLASDQQFDEAIIYFGLSGVDNTNAVNFYAGSSNNPIPFAAGDKLVLTAPDKEMNLNQFHIETSNSGDGVTIQYTLYAPYNS